MSDIPSVVEDLAFYRFKQSDQQFEQYCFTGARLTNNQIGLSSIKRSGDSFQNGRLPKSHVYILRFDHSQDS